MFDSRFDSIIINKKQAKKLGIKFIPNIDGKEDIMLMDLGVIIYKLINKIK